MRIVGFLGQRNHFVGADDGKGNKRRRTEDSRLSLATHQINFSNMICSDSDYQNQPTNLS